MFMCPIGQHVMVEPVFLTTESGRCYEKSLLHQALQRKPNTDPFTNVEYDYPLAYFPHRALADMIADWKRDNMTVQHWTEREDVAQALRKTVAALRVNPFKDGRSHGTETIVIDFTWQSPVDNARELACSLTFTSEFITSKTVEFTYEGSPPETLSCCDIVLSAIPMRLRLNIITSLETKLLRLE